MGLFINHCKNKNCNCRKCANAGKTIACKFPCMGCKDVKFLGIEKPHKWLCIGFKKKK